MTYKPQLQTNQTNKQTATAKRSKNNNRNWFQNFNQHIATQLTSQKKLVNSLAKNSLGIYKKQQTTLKRCLKILP